MEGYILNNKQEIIIFFITVLAFFSYIGSTFAIIQPQNEITCEICPMKVGADALEHLEVYDGTNTRHYVECIGCALKLLNTCDELQIKTFCDWYGPKYTVMVNISQQGAVVSVDPITVLILKGGGCTGYRIAYNQTAAAALLANGFSENTMMMMRQPLPANTNTTTITEMAKTFVQTQGQTTQSSLMVQTLLAIIGVGVVLGSFVVYKKLRK